MNTQNTLPSSLPAQHTPGPWTATEGGVFSQHLNGHGNFYVAALPFHSEEPTPSDKANLALIAAAPELLAALERILSVSRAGLDSGGNVHVALNLAKGEARAAIAKAKGGAS